MHNVDKLKTTLDDGIKIQKEEGELAVIIGHCKKDETKIVGEMYLNASAELLSELVMELFQQCPEVEYLFMVKMLKVKLAMSEGEQGVTH